MTIYRYVIYMTIYRYVLYMTIYRYAIYDYIYVIYMTIYRYVLYLIIYMYVLYMTIYRWTERKMYIYEDKRGICFCLPLGLKHNVLGRVCSAL